MAPPARPASRRPPAEDSTALGGTRAARLVRGLGWTAAALALLTALLYLVLGTGPTLAEIPWFGAFVLNLQALICLTASVLMLGRHRVVHDPTCYWTGIGFSIYGLALVFYVLAWPGSLPDGRSFIATLPGTSAWFTLVVGAGSAFRPSCGPTALSRRCSMSRMAHWQRCSSPGS